jgi:hypothetical protein
VTGKNFALLKVLGEIGWSQSDLARAVNAVMGSGYISRSTVSEWTNHARIPRDPLPTVVTHVLSEAAGRELLIDTVWQGKAPKSQLWVPALDGMCVGWQHADMLSSLRGWLDGREAVLDFDHRTFLPMQGDSLTEPVWSYVESTSFPVSPIEYHHDGKRDGRMVSRSMAHIAAQMLQQMRRLDDAEGASLENLRFVHRYALSIADSIDSGEAADSTVLRELLDLWMQLCQLAGWMAYDAQQHGLAQRYWCTGLHAARSLGDRDYGAYIVTLLARQAVHRSRVDEAARLITGATVAAKAGPPMLRAFVESIRIQVEALAGNSYGMDSAAESAMELAEDSEAPDTKPRWLYWFTAARTRVHHGQALVTLYDRAAHPAKHRLELAARLLAPNSLLDDAFFPREAAYNRVWLAQSQVRRGDVPTALRTARSILEDGVVRSPRCVSQLHRLDSELNHYATKGNLDQVREFHGRLQNLVAQRRVA